MPRKNPVQVVATPKESAQYADEACFQIRESDEWLLVYRPKATQDEPRPEAAVLCTMPPYVTLGDLLGMVHERGTQLIVEERFADLLEQAGLSDLGADDPDSTS